VSKHSTSRPEPDHEPAPAYGYSYVRFSRPDQAKGDSLRRQTQKTADWCQHHHVTLDTSLSLLDLGVSAFKGRHRDDKFALGQFLKLAERGRIPKGSYLIIENLDRLTREDERKALRLWMDILDAGIHIVQLHPETIFRHDRTDMIDVMRAIIELSRAHSESVQKSERLTAVWGEKKRRGREDNRTITKQLPAWVHEVNGKRVNIPARAAVVKRIYLLAARGYGHCRIVRLLTAEGVPAFGRSGRWSLTYVTLLLGDRRTLGEHQPTCQAGQPDGEAIKGYYEPVVTEKEWLAAQAGQAGRKSVRRPARPVENQAVVKMHRDGQSVAAIARQLGISRPRVYRILTKGQEHSPQERGNRYVHLFTRLLKNARDGLAYYPVTRRSNGQTQHVLVAASAHEMAAGPCHGLSYRVFERAVLDQLREIEPAEVLAGANGHDEVVRLEAELAGVDAELAKVDVLMHTEGISATADRYAKELETRRRDLAEQKAVADHKAKNPLSAAWGEAQSLLEVLDKAPDVDDARLRLRAALCRVVESIWIMVVPRGQDRLAEVQVWFKDSEAFRTYLIVYRASRGNAHRTRPGRVYVSSLRQPDAAKMGMPFNLDDLRDRQEADGVRRFLEAFPQWLIDKLLAEGRDVV
jgi:DNA invertase Pin-like site-specific DNA recombinase